VTPTTKISFTASTESTSSNGIPKSSNISSDTSTTDTFHQCKSKSTAFSSEPLASTIAGSTISVPSQISKTNFQANPLSILTMTVSMPFSSNNTTMEMSTTTSNNLIEIENHSVAFKTTTNYQILESQQTKTKNTVHSISTLMLIKMIEKNLDSSSIIKSLSTQTAVTRHRIIVSKNISIFTTLKTIHSKVKETKTNILVDS
jgi:hypothetical protein